MPDDEDRASKGDADEASDSGRRVAADGDARRGKAPAREPFRDFVPYDLGFVTDATAEHDEVF